MFAKDCVVLLLGVLLLWAQNVQSQGICAAFNYGIYTAANPNVCHEYYYCTSAGQTNPPSLPCDFGLFYDSVKLACDYASSVSCGSDPCKVAGTLHYAYPGICSAYFYCDGGRTAGAKCCAPGEGYQASVGCVANVGCTDECSPKTTKAPCTLKVDPNNPRKFLQKTDSGISISHDCSPGTEFVSATCDCSKLSLFAQQSPCESSVHLRLDNNVQDIDNRWWVKNIGQVTAGSSGVPAGFIGTGAATFSQSNYLSLETFTWYYISNRLRIDFRFYTAASGQVESLVNNYDCMGNKVTSVSITYNRNKNEVVAKLVTTNSNIQVTASANSQSWNSVVFDYDGANLKLTVNAGTPAQAAANGNVKNAGPLQIGGGCKATGFSGFIDEFFIYFCP